MATRVRIALLALLLSVAGCGGDGAGPRTSSGGVVVWAVGDGATGSDGAIALGRRIAEERPTRFLYLGDVYPDGTEADFRERYDPIYGQLAPITEPTPGNHEWDNRAQGYEPYWKGKKGRAVPSAYDFELAGWQILSLNSQDDHGPGSAQLRYLREASGGGGTCRLAFWHRPRFSGGERGDEDIAPLWDALRGRAALVVNGHDHNSQRFAPRDGITQLIAGAGGANFYPVDREEPGLEWAEDGVRAALRLTLRPGRADYAFVTEDGRELDSGSVTCRPPGVQK